MKLDSVSFDRECKELGIPVPKDPDVFEKINIHNKYTSHTLNQMATKHNDIANNQ